MTRAQPGFVDVRDCLDVSFGIVGGKLFAETVVADSGSQRWAVLGQYVFGHYFALIPFGFGKEAVDGDSIGI